MNMTRNFRYAWPELTLDAKDQPEHTLLHFPASQSQFALISLPLDQLLPCLTPFSPRPSYTRTTITPRKESKRSNDTIPGQVDRWHRQGDGP